MSWWSKLRGQSGGVFQGAGSGTDRREAEATEIEALLENARLAFEHRDFDACRTLLNEALSIAPHHPLTLVRSGRLHRRSGQFSEALRQYDEALLVALEPAHIHMEIGETHAEARDLPSAIDALTTAIALDPSLGEAWMRLGAAHGRLDHRDEALEAFRMATTTAPQALQAEAWFQYGQALHVLQRHSQALEAYGECLACEPEAERALLAAGHAELLLEHDESALQYYERALSLRGLANSGQHLHLGAAYQYAGRWREAQSLFEQVVAHNPSHHLARWYLSQCDLALCNWPRGWDNYSSRFGAGASPYRPLPFRPWQGLAAQDETLLILADQGLGDEILFASCIPDAMARVSHCIVECEPRLANLFRRSFPEATVVASDRQADGRWLQGLAEPQWQIFSGDLPALFRRADADFPHQRAYLQADPERVDYWRQRLEADLGPGLKIGISWRGGTAYTRMRSRSLSPEDWAPILATPGCRFVNLQYGNYQPELAEINARFGGAVVDYPEALADYDETAALVAALDLVTTVCTAVVHLAGSLGRPTWVLVPFSPGWRYTIARTFMPWYAQTRLFRQATIGDWKMPCHELAAALAELTQNVTSEPCS